MSGIGILIVLFALGVVILVAEIFIPSHGVLTLAGLALLVVGVVKTFEFGSTAGTIAVLACLVFIPTFAMVAVKVWHRTPMGRLISPPNPVHAREDTSVPIDELTALIGQTGVTRSPLRPAGIVDFGGKRVSCVAQLGMIESGVEVEGVGVKGSSLAVVEKKG